MTPNPVIAEPIAVELILADWPIRLLVNRKYLPFLKENGLLQGDALLNLSNHSLVKKHYHRGGCDRIVDRVLLGNHKIKAYRKICRSPCLSRSIKYWLEGVRNIPRRNWTANLNLAAAGIPVAAPIALIEKRTGPFASESALLTAELSGYLPLSRLLYQAYLENRPQAFTQLKRKLADALTRLRRGLPISDEAIEKGLAGVSWPARMEILSRRPVVVADGAHSRDAARRLRESLTDYFSCHAAFLIVGMSTHKDVSGVAQELAPIARRAVAVRANHPRAMAPQDVAAAFLETGVETEVGEEVAEALDKTMATADDQAVICLAGSLFVAAEGRAHLGRLR